MLVVPLVPNAVSEVASNAAHNELDSSSEINCHACFAGRYCCLAVAAPKNGDLARWGCNRWALTNAGRKFDLRSANPRIFEQLPLQV